MLNTKWSIMYASLLTVFAIAGCSSPVYDDTVDSNDLLTIHMMMESFGDIPDMNNAYYSALQRKTGVDLDINWVPTEDYSEHFKLLLASNQIPEIAVFDSPNHPLLIQSLQSERFWNLSPLLGDFSEYPNLRDHVPQQSFNYVKFRGQLWRFRARILISTMVSKFVKTGNANAPKAK